MQRDIHRLERVQKLMREEDIDVLICRLTENVLYLTGYWPVIGASIVLFRQDGDTTLIIPSSEKDYTKSSWVEDIRTYPFINMETLANPTRDTQPFLQEVAREKEYEQARIGYEGSFDLVAANNVAAETRIVAESTVRAFRQALPQATFVDATNLIKEARRIKSQVEIEKLRIVSEIAAIGFKKAQETIKAGVTEAAVAGAVEGQTYGEGVGYKGVERARGFCFVMSGENSVNAWRPFCMSSNKQLVEGEPVLVEFDVMADGYYTDFTRTFMVGGQTSQSRKVFEAVSGAVNGVMEEMKPGVRASELDAIAHSIIDKHGYGEYFPHQLGHGIGLQFHDPFPTLHPASEDVLEAGMVLAIEPGVYIPGWGAVRIEENVVVTESGCESLCPFPQWEES